jgi:glycosyltransferase involved in cell wall biosynthesis
MNLTVVIPTYNGAIRLPSVLDKLKAQEGCENISWEVLVVDNNSTDNTREVFDSYARRWDLDAPLRYVFEERQGLAFARKRAVDEARGEIVSFLDDDVLPEKDFVKKAVSFKKSHPKAGVWGAEIRGVYHGEVPRELSTIKSHLAVQELGCKPFKIDPTFSGVAVAGGCFAAIRTEMKKHMQGSLFLSGVSAGNRVAGEEYEVFFKMFKSGWELWYAPDMIAYHQIPAERLTAKYLRWVCWTNGLSVFATRVIITKPLIRPLVFIRQQIGSVIRIVRHLWKFKGKAFLETVPSAELSFYLGLLYSPYFYLILLMRKWLNGRGSVH